LEYSGQLPAWLAAAAAALLVLGFLVYGTLLRRLLASWGKVRVGRLGFPDLLFAVVLSTWFLVLAASGFRHAPKPVQGSDILSGSLIYMLVISAIIFSLRSRRIHALRLFGIHRLSFPVAFGIGTLLLVAAYPLIVSAFAATQSFMGLTARRQEIVEFFIDASHNADRWSLVMTMLLGIVLAPIAEEFIFRGYLYGVFKRYLGISAALLLNSALFAAVHLNLASLPALFVLAACFTIAYEATGSLLVSMCMHALFNLASFAAMLTYSNSFK
jgi:membrane protease YdiL (CAAX protease family)